MAFEAFDFGQIQLRHFVYGGLKAPYKKHATLVVLFAVTSLVHLCQKITTVYGWEFLDHYKQVATRPK